MGQQLNALEHSDQPYVKAVDDFSHLAYIQFVKPFIKLFWYPGGYETKTKHCEKLLKGKTEKVSSTMILSLVVRSFRCCMSIVVLGNPRAFEAPKRYCRIQKKAGLLGHVVK